MVREWGKERRGIGDRRRIGVEVTRKDGTFRGTTAV